MHSGDSAPQKRRVVRARQTQSRAAGSPQAGSAANPILAAIRRSRSGPTTVVPAILKGAPRIQIAVWSRLSHLCVGMLDTALPSQSAYSDLQIVVAGLPLKPLLGRVEGALRCGSHRN